MTNKQAEALELLMQNVHRRDIATRLNVTTRLVEKWMYEVDEFKTELRRREQVEIDDLRRRYRSLGSAALASYERALNGDCTTAQQKVAASILRTLAIEAWEPVPEQLKPYTVPTGIKIEVVKPAPLGMNSVATAMSA